MKGYFSSGAWRSPHALESGQQEIKGFSEMHCASHWESIYGPLQASCNSFQGDEMQCVFGFISYVNSAFRLLNKKYLLLVLKSVKTTNVISIIDSLLYFVILIWF